MPMKNHELANWSKTFDFIFTDGIHFVWYRFKLFGQAMDEPCGCQNLNTIHIFYNVKKRTITFIHKCFMLFVSTGKISTTTKFNSFSISISSVEIHGIVDLIKRYRHL